MTDSAVDRSQERGHTTFLFTISWPFKDRLDLEAGKRGISTGELIRRACANYVGYDLAEERMMRKPRMGRPRLYATSEEAQEARRERARKDKELKRALLDDYKHQEREKAAKALQDSLHRREVK